MITTITLSTIFLGAYSAPIWGAISAGLVFLGNTIFKALDRRTHNKENNREQTRDDFVVIRDSLNSEIERLKESQSAMAEDNKKCEQKYYELSIQYRELLRYYSILSNKVKDLQNSEQTITPGEDSGTTKS